jgi:hypothetical protein
MQRPRDVTLISLVILVAGVAKLISAAAAFMPAPPGTLVSQVWLAIQDLIASELRYDLLTVAVLLSLGIFEALSAIGMLGMRAWAWLMAMVVQGAYLAIELARYPSDGPLPGGMALAVVVVFYLNQRHIRRAFRVALRHSDPAGMLTAEDKLSELEEEEPS